MERQWQKAGPLGRERPVVSAEWRRHPGADIPQQPLEELKLWRLTEM